ncbi:hypothetical protein [Flagellimonas myxillae]|uniref:hypothetical protein n=1 Tax=Flagellimonas myxillae TaxID=2942214 RepID=UPI00201F9941|nr:hypothetical protein [Muricauda myxillae]MCL6265910.1 hypothetical protein [Muricauda myxillae]
MYPDHKLVRKCLLQIEENLGWGASENWHNDVFVELSERIQEKTKVLLSPVTLKRLWGRIDYQSAPSKTTLNTLAQFAGFQNWRDFKGRTSIKKQNPLARIVSANLGVIMLSASVMTVIFISFFSLKGTREASEVIDPSTIVFTSKPIAKGLPNSVVFDLDLGSIQSDSIHIQQYWDPTKTIDLNPGQKQATGQYYRPGYFRAKLLVDGKVIKQHDLFIKSEGWMGTVDYTPIPKYLSNADVFENKLQMPSEILEEIAQNKDPLMSTFHLVEDFPEISGDDFLLESTVQNTYREKWAVCQNMGIIILGTKGALVIPFAIQGCVSEIGIMLNDVYLSGKEHDLSNLGVDLSVPRNLIIRVENKRLTVSSEERELFSGSYNESVGRIVGLRYRFLGAGQVLHCKLSDLQENVVAVNDGASE